MVARLLGISENMYGTYLKHMARNASGQRRVARKQLSVATEERERDARRCPGPLWHCIVHAGLLPKVSLAVSMLLSGPFSIGMVVPWLFPSHPVRLGPETVNSHPSLLPPRS